MIALRWLLLTLFWSVCTARAAVGGDAIADAITELDVQRARSLLESGRFSSEAAQFQRARLAIYVSDFDSAQALLRTLPPSPAVNTLADLAQSAGRAVAGGLIIEDQTQGIWLRLQDDADRPLVPRIIEVLVLARDAIARDLGVELPRPLRIELVNDLFSLSAISGLPLEAAETTGTVAVARWGRVTMLSPRAAPYGYPWEDTLAHEVTHLGLTRATRDRAPLWLQEGVAKQGEERWRSPRALDDRHNADAVARNALVTGASVGVDALGPSIAMLPSADAAGIAFAEVKSFMDFLIAKVGRPAFQLLLADLKGLGLADYDPALRSVTGFDLDYWIARWQDWLMSLPKESQIIDKDPINPTLLASDPLDLARHARLGELFQEAERFRLAAQHFDSALRYQPEQPALRFEAARSWLSARDETKARKALGTVQEISDLHGGWFALHGLFLKAQGDTAAAGAAFDLAMAVDPFAFEVACEGELRMAQPSRALHNPSNNGPSSPNPLSPNPLNRAPSNPIRREICLALNRAD